MAAYLVILKTKEPFCGVEFAGRLYNASTALVADAESINALSSVNDPGGVPFSTYFLHDGKTTAIKATRKMLRENLCLNRIVIIF